MNSKKQKPNAIEKALDILMAFTPHNEPMGTAEISKKLGFHNATASRILLTLTNRRFLRQDARTKKFALGRSALDIGRAAIDSLNTNLVQIAKSHIDQLRTDLSETIVLEQLKGKSTVIVYVAEGPLRVRIAGTIGDRLPTNAAAGAKAILAYLEPETARNIIQEQNTFCQFTPKTITDPKSLIRQLQEIRRKGFSIDAEEIDIGVNAIGAPIFNYENFPVAAVVVAGLTSRVTVDAAGMVSKLKETAERISAELKLKVVKNY